MTMPETIQEASSPANRKIGYAEGCATETARLRELVHHLGAGPGRQWNPAWRHVMLAGIGASHAALATPLLTLREGGLTAWRTDGSDMPTVGDDLADVAILLSQSGHSTEIVDLAQRLKASGVPALAITNTSANPLVHACPHAITLGDHADSRISTVGFVITYAALAMLTELASTGTIDPAWYTLPDVIDAAVDRAAPTLDRFASTALTTGSVDVIASSDQLSAAEAVALLFREGPLVPAAAYGTRSYLHGPMDCAGSDVAHIVIGDQRERQLADQMTDRSGRIMLVSDRYGSDGMSSLVPGGLPVRQRALVSVCLLQRLVAATAQVRGNPIDDAVFTRQDTKIAENTPQAAG